MLDYGIVLSGDSNLTRNFDRLPFAVQEILREKFEDLADEMLGSLLMDIDEKDLATGEGTGMLAASADVEVREVDGGVQLIVGFDGSVEYARIQDKGGQIPAHMIYPRNAKVLSWIGPEGKRLYARRVFHPGAMIPPKNYLKDLKRKYAATIARQAKVAIVQGLRSRMRGLA